MKKIFNESQLVELNSIIIEVIERIRETIDVLDENYGANRHIDNNFYRILF